MFLSYLRQQLLLEGKPVIQYFANKPVLFCSKGLFDLDIQQLDSNFLADRSDEFVTSLTLLIDANEIDNPGGARFIPLVSSTPLGYIAPRIVYATSPKLRYIKNQLLSKIAGKFQVRLMNPWTPFEIEVM